MQKTPLLLLHGALGTAKNFVQFMPLLQDEFDVHTFDFIAHGRNSNDDNSLIISNLSKQIEGYMSERSMSSAHIFGYSMGGYTAMYLAATQPQKVLSLMTFATKWDWNEASASKEAAMLNASKMEEKVPKFAAYLAALHGDEHWKTLVEKVKNMMLDLGKANPFSEDIISSVQIPILLGVGDKDTTVSIDETLAMYRLLPNAHFFVAPNTPHALERVDAKLLVGLMKVHFGRESKRE